MFFKRKTYMKTFLSAVLIVFVFNSLNLNGLYANETSRLTGPMQEILEERDQNEFIRVNILLKDQYDSGELYMQSRTQKDRHSKRQFVVSVLQDHAARSQTKLLSLLEERRTEGRVQLIRPVWLTNMINATLQLKVVEELRHHPDILLIDYDREYDLLLIPDCDLRDEALVFPDKLNRAEPEPVWSVEKVNAPAVWDLGTTGQGVVVAVLDTGVNYNHTDLQGNMWEHPDYPGHGYNFSENNHNTMDYNRHGTHCAGTVAGNGASGLKTGVAPGAQIMALKVLNNQGSGSLANVVLGVEFAVEHGADILSLSLGANIANLTPEVRSYMRGVFDNVLSAGVIAAVAAGNNGTSGSAPYRIGLPGDIPPPWLHPDQTITGGISSVVSVGSVTIDGERSRFSSVGPSSWQYIEPYLDYPFDPEIGLIRPDIVAPGTDIISLAHNNNSGYLSLSGTSMATPAVAGGLALMLSKEPELTPEQMSMILELSADKKTETKSNEYGSGRMDALQAFGDTPYMTGIMYVDHETDDSEGNDDGVVNPGETVSLNVTFKNVGETDIDDAYAELFTYSEYITVIDHLTELPLIAAGDSLTVNGAFSFTVAESAPGNHPARFRIETNFGQNGHRTIMIFTEQVHGPEVIFSDALFIPQQEDDDFIIKGETKELSVMLINNGQLETGDLIANLDFDSQYAFVVSQEGFELPSILPGDSVEVRFWIHAHHDAPSNSGVVMQLVAESSTHYFEDTQQFFINEAKRFEEGRIPTTLVANPTTNHSAEEPGVITFSVPLGAIITGVDVSYSMTSQTGAIINEQFSFIRCITEGGTSEAQISQGEGSFIGTYHYQRSNLDIANGVTGGGDIEFELHAFRTWGGSGSNETFAYVDDGTWELAVHYYMPRHDVTFFVRNQVDDFVEGAVVNVSSTSLETDHEGVVHFELPEGLLYVSASAESHLPLSNMPFNVVSEANNTYEIVLTRLFNVFFDVVDVHGNAVEDFQIIIETDTLASGEHVIAGLAEGTYSFLVEANQYLPYDGTFEITNDDKNIEVVMQTDGTGAFDLDATGLKVFPNPAGRNIFVESAETIESLQLIDLMGNIIYAAQVETNSYNINVSELLSGLYLIQVKTRESIIVKRVQVVR